MRILLSVLMFLFLQSSFAASQEVINGIENTLATYEACTGDGYDPLARIFHQISS